MNNQFQREQPFRDKTLTSGSGLTIPSVLKQMVYNTFARIYWSRTDPFVGKEVNMKFLVYT